MVHPAQPSGGDVDGKTLLTFHELYPSKDALDAAFEGSEGCMPEQFGQLDELLLSLGKPD